MPKVIAATATTGERNRTKPNPPASELARGCVARRSPCERFEPVESRCRPPRPVPFNVPPAVLTVFSTGIVAGDRIRQPSFVLP
jgi:hypothetical protein